MKKQFALFTILSFLFIGTSSWAQTGLNGIPVGSTTPSTGNFTNLEADTGEFTDLEATNSFKLNGETANSFDDISAGTATNTSQDAAIAANTATNAAQQIAIDAAGVSNASQQVTILENTSDIEANTTNILLNAFRDTEALDRSPLKMKDGVVDGFNNETGVDTASSTNEEYDTGGDLYRATVSGGATIPMIGFDGTDDYINRGGALTGVSDSKVGTISFWFVPNVNVGSLWIISAGSGNTDRFFVRQIGSIIEVSGNNSDFTSVLSVSSLGSDLVPGQLVHVLASWDLANSKTHLYINGVDRTNPATVINKTIDYTISDWMVGARALGGPSAYTNGELGQMWFSTTEYIDISVATNREKFIDSSGNPVDLGTNGSTPTGNQPILYLNNSLSAWQNNLGTGGDFTVNGGGLAAGTNLSGTPDNMTLISNSQTAKTEANDAHVVLFAEDPAADIVLNTDLKASVSRDGGTTFSQVTLSDAGEFEKGNLLTGTVDISSQPTGTDMQWKVETLNNKALNLHGVGLEWR